MANLTQIKLPNNTTYDIKDASALATMTFSGHTLQTVARGGASNNIDIGTFDALTATDLTAGNLVVNGTGRFTNGIIGDLTGNVTGNLTGTASSLSTEVGTSAGERPVWYSYLGDNTKAVYNTNFKYNPSGNILYATTFSGSLSGNATSATNADYLTVKSLSGTSVITQTGTFAFMDVGNSAANSKVGIQVDKEYTSGTNIKFQLYSGRDGLYYRQWYYTNSSWASAVPVLTSSNYNTYAPSLTGTGASGSWGIDITGNAATATSATTATKATGDGDGNTISSTYLKLSGGTMTGDLTIKKSTTIANNYPAKLNLQVNQTDNNLTYTSSYIAAYDDHDTANNGLNMVIQSGGNMFIGGGESPSALYNAIGKNSTGENVYLTADSVVYIESNANTIANRLGFYLDASHNVVPCKAEASTNNVGSIGTSTYRWANVYATSANTNTVYVNIDSSGTSGGLSLYGGGSVMHYGLAVRSTTNSGVHGYVSGDYATYAYMNGTSSNISTRGWVLRDAVNSANVASVSCAGNAVFNGSVTVGGNAANTSGCRLVFNSTTSSLDFVFV